MTFRIRHESTDHGTEVVLAQDGREIERFTVGEFEDFTRECSDALRSARAQSSKNVRLKNLPMRSN